MKFWNIIIFLLFLNFTALPSIAAIFDWDIPSTEMVYEEEEEVKNIDTIEKTLPEEFNTKRFLQIAQVDYHVERQHVYKEPIHSAPYLNLFSPPPEV